MNKKPEQLYWVFDEDGDLYAGSNERTEFTLEEAEAIADEIGGCYGRVDEE